MKIKHFSTILFICLFVVTPCGPAYPCYFDYSDEDYRVFYFNPAVAETSKILEAFHYSKSFYFKRSSPYPENEEGEDPDMVRNCKEWQAQLGKGIDLGDIDTLMYQTEPAIFLKAYNDTTLTTIFPANSFVKALVLPKNKDLLNYFVFAKQSELVRGYDRASDPWSGKSSQAQDALMSAELVKDAKMQLKKTKNKFLRQRWAFQIILLGSNVGSNYAEKEKVYNKYLGPKNKNTVLNDWAIMKLAEQNPDSIGRNLMYANAFRLYPSRYLLAANYFCSAWTEKTYQRAKTRSEKASVLAIRSVQNKGRGINDLKRIMALYPDYHLLPLLINREINKVEDWVLTPRISGHFVTSAKEPDWDWEDPNYDLKIDRWKLKNQKKDQRYVKELRLFLEEVNEQTTESKRIKPLLQLAIAHLYYIDNQFDKANFILQNMKLPAKKSYQIQQKIQELLLLPKVANILDPVVQDQLYKKIYFIQKNKSKVLAYNEQLGRIYLLLSHAFFDRKDIIKAGFFLYKSSPVTGIENDSYNADMSALGFFHAHASLSNVAQLERLIRKKRKSKLEQFLLKPIQEEDYLSNTDSDSNMFYYDEDIDVVPSQLEILELRGAIALRDGNLKLANAAFAQIPDSFWIQHYRMWDYDYCGATNLIATDSIPIDSSNNRRTLVQKMLFLQEEAAKNPKKRAENYYLLGNAWFHCSYWGKASMVFARGWSPYEDDINPKNRPGPGFITQQPLSRKHRLVYYRCIRAIAYYKMVLANKPDPELAARTQYMLAECDRFDRWMTARNQGRKATIEEGDVASPLFKSWARKYKNTATYQECLSKCPPLRAFLGLNDPAE